MKLALMFGGTASENIPSFYVKNGTMYDFKHNKPHIFEAALSPQFVTQIWNFCFFYKDGVFLNLADWDATSPNSAKLGDELPDFDFDVIVYANERWGLDDKYWDKYSVARLKNKYPKAKVIGYVKEITVPDYRYKGWIRFLNDCDQVMAPAIDALRELPKYKEIQSELNKKINYCSPSPDNINLIYDKFYSDKKNNSIFIYIPTSMNRRGDTIPFANYISQKYDIPLVHKPYETHIDDNGVEVWKVHSDVKGSMSWEDFMNLLTPCMYHFNLDPSEMQPGQQAIMVANVGSINIGGVNESHHILYPETATCDVEILEKRFVEYLNNPEKRFEVVKYAWDKLNEFYGSVVVKKQLLQVLNQK